MHQYDLSSDILRVLYDAWFPQAGYLDVAEIAATQGWEKRLCDEAVDRLKHSGLIEGVGFGNHCRLTARGIFLAEARGYADTSRIEINQESRRRVLEQLMATYEDSPHKTDVHFKAMAKKCELDERTVLGIFALLVVQGLVAEHNVGSYRISIAGIDWLRSNTSEEAGSGFVA